MRVLFLFLLLVGSLSSQTTIAGHHLGETVPEFIASEPGYADKIASCHAAEPRPITAAQVHAMKGEELTSLQITVPGLPSKRALEQLAAQGKLLSKDDRIASEKTFCKSIIGALEQGASAPIYDTFGPQLRLWEFRNRVLSYIYIVLPEDSFQSSKDAMTARLSEKPIVTSTPMLNAMGAQWMNGIARWLNSELFVSILDDRNPARPSVSLTVYSRAAYDLERARTTAPAPF